MASSQLLKPDNMKNVITTEKTRVLSTLDYSIFNLNESLSISKKHLTRIKNSIYSKNLCPDYPILVSEGYDILEGKYRFLACYQLQLPIYYKIAEVTTLRDAIHLKHITRKTPTMEVIEIYKENPNYGNLIEMFREYQDDKLTIKTILRIIRWDNTTNPFESFYSGNLRDWSIDEFKSRVEWVKEVMDYLNHPYFYDTLKGCIKRFGKCANDNQYSHLQMHYFKKFFEYRNKDKVPFARYQSLMHEIWIFDEFLRGSTDRFYITDGVLSAMGIKMKSKPRENSLIETEYFSNSYK